MAILEEQHRPSWHSLNCCNSLLNRISLFLVVQNAVSSTLTHSFANLEFTGVSLTLAAYLYKDWNDSSGTVGFKCLMQSDMAIFETFLNFVVMAVVMAVYSHNTTLLGSAILSLVSSSSYF